MRQFYLLNPIRPTSVELNWSGYIELLPVKDEKTRKRLARRVPGGTGLGLSIVKHII